MSTPQKRDRNAMEKEMRQRGVGVWEGTDQPGPTPKKKHFVKRAGLRELHCLMHVQGCNAAALTAVRSLNDGDVLIVTARQGNDVFYYLEHGAWNVEESIGVAKQWAEALESLHRKNMAHMDVKPENAVWCEETKSVLFIDFGTALIAGSTQEVSRAATPAYMPPEGHSEIGNGCPEANKAYDCWSMGVVLYKMLAGLPPFENILWTSKTFLDIQQLFGCPTISRTSKNVLDAQKLVGRPKIFGDIQRFFGRLFLDAPQKWTSKFFFGHPKLAGVLPFEDIQASISASFSQLPPASLEA